MLFGYSPTSVERLRKESSARTYIHSAQRSLNTAMGAAVVFARACMCCCDLGLRSAGGIPA